MTPPRDPFRSARLFYRAVRGAEDDHIFAEINEDRIGYMNSNGSNNRLPLSSDAERFRKSMEDNLMSAIICLPETTTKDPPSPLRAGTPIGQIHLNGSSLRTVHHRRTEIGIDILPQFQGQGYGSEAIRWALEYAFSRTGMHKVRICAFEWNEGACRLYRRLGFKEEGRNREAMWHEGRFWDVVDLGMLDREWWAMEGERKREKGEGKEGEKEKEKGEEKGEVVVGERKDESGVVMI